MKKRLLRRLFIMFAGLVILSMSSCDLVNSNDDDDNNNELEADVVLKGNITKNMTLHAQDSIILAAQTFVKSGVTLTIEEGTTIYALADDGKGLAPALIIERGATLIAEGTPENPITFTSILPKDILERNPRGNWGGLILLGNAPVNIGESYVEGLAGIPYGGNNPDDNSGVLRYVRVWYGGRSIGQDNEINGITLAGVGRGTTVEYCEVAFNLDDGFEMFGGTVNIKYCAAIFCGDDQFDTDLGYQGKGQFLVALVGGDDGNRGFEMDNDGSNMDLQPRSFPQFHNVTIIGSGEGSSADNDQCIRLREGTGGDFRNMIIYQGKDYAVRISDDPTEALITPDLSGAISPNYIYFSPNNIIYDTPNLFYEGVFSAIQENPGLSLEGRETGGNINLLPTPNGPAFQQVDELPNDSFFESVDFKGAFGQENWLEGWSILSELNRF
ncbi:MAG: hypothetical protein PHE86_03875 [Candidatus Marinimicrobia bacterium]|nr:hypothetical protein [Candidatus Neomarinimicrobiota bacterium]